MPEELRDRKGGSIPSSQRFAGVASEASRPSEAEASVYREKPEGSGGLANAEAGSILSAADEATDSIAHADVTVADVSDRQRRCRDEAHALLTRTCYLRPTTTKLRSA